MALTPEQIAQLRGEAGLSPTPPAKGVNSDDIIAQRKAKLGIVDEPTPTTDISKPMGGADRRQMLMDKTKEAFKGGIESAKQGYQTALEASNNPDMGVWDKTKAQIYGGRDIASGAASAISAPITGAIETLSEDISNKPGVQEFTNTPVVSKALDVLNTMKAPLDQISQSHPEAAKNLSDSLNILFTIMGLKETAGKFKTGVVEPIKQIADSTKTAKTTAAVGDDLMAITEKIQPKPTAKEARLAMEQGRLYEGTEGTMFKEGQPGRMAASEQQARSANTIKKYIPDAAKLDNNTLYTEIKNNVSNIAQKLKPEMQKVPIKPETVSKMAEDWKALKAEQSGPFAPKGVIKPMQTHFEEVLKSIKSGTVDDIWEAAKKYDESVPDRVKNATELSDSVLQTQKEIWLDNRKILRDAINDSENGLGQTSRQAFAEMRDLYEAQNGLLTKAKVETTPKPSKLQKTIEKYKSPLKTGGAIIGGAGAAEVLRRSIGI